MRLLVRHSIRGKFEKGSPSVVAGGDNSIRGMRAEADWRLWLMAGGNMAQLGGSSRIGTCLLLGGCLLVLAACDARQWPLGTQSSASQKPAARQQQARPEAVASVSPSSVPKVSEPIAGANLIGLDSTETQKRLGPPNEEDHRAPAKIWRYHYAQCTLDVTLYPDVQTQVFRVLSYEVNNNDGTEQGKRQCNAGIRSRVGAK